jgi:hypothetical protein
MSGHKIILICFWVCWTGTVIIPITGHLGIDYGLLLLECILFPIGLCFASALCVRDFPGLSKLGMNSLVITFIVSIAVAVVLNR